MLKKYKPITPSLRHRVIVDRSDLDKVIVEKQLKGKLTKNGGRNKTGRITCRHRGGGHKRSIRYIDLTNKKKNNLVVTNEYDPNRTCYISRCYNNVFKCSYILSPITKGINKISQLKDLKLGTSVYNIQGKYCRSGGSFGKIVKHEGSNTIIRLPSKHLIEVNSEEYVKEGKGSNHLNKFTKDGKAGAKRWKGIRPTVKGYAMNACDHPHGGNTKGGSQPKSKWGKLAKWVKSK